MTDSLEDLLHALCSGDQAATEKAFRQFEPFLRSVVRRRLDAGLRAKFDSEDIVQSVWGTLLTGFRDAGWRFQDVNHLRAFLVKVTQNRFIDRARQHGRAVGLERPLADLDPNHHPPTREPRPSQLAERDELWQRVLALCPSEHQEVVRLRRDGLSLEEIAGATGLHPDSVRRVLRNLARRLALGQGTAV
jgi:RNA polymerase sigma-70 factor (ECF subfamily)